MAYKFNPFTGTLDYYNASNGNVAGIPPTDIRAIARWADTGGTTIENSPGTLVQDGGSIQAQDFIQNRQVATTIDIPSNYTMQTDSIEMQPGGVINMQPGSKIIIV